MKNNLEISLVVPCYNEEANIQKGVLDKIGDFTQNDKRFKEIIIVDDGSTDNSKKIITTKYLGLFPKFKLLENNHRGKAYAVISGIRNSVSSYVMFVDIDLATPIEESEKLITCAEKGKQIVIGSRSVNREGAPLSRKLMAVGFIIVRDILIGLKGIRDTQCGFKLFERKAAMNIIEKLKVFNAERNTTGPSVSAGFDLEFLFIATKLEFSIEEIPVIWRHVETKRVNFLKDSLETLKDIVTIKYYHLKNMYVL